MSREKPVPPPKPVAKTYKYESLTEFLVKEGFDPSICMHLELSANMCQGNLYKLGGMQFFILRKLIDKLIFGGYKFSLTF